MNENRLLVVEDDDVTCSALRSIFSRRGWEVSVARTVAEGLARLDPAPTCLVLDLGLPDGAGEAVLRAVRARKLETRVAVCTGTTDARRLASVMALHPDVLLAKPYDLGPVFHLCRPAQSG